jgi:hypothetical protein
MKIATAQSGAADIDVALHELLQALDIDLLGHPDFLSIHFGVGASANHISSTVRSRLSSVALHGGSSCLGVMSQHGVNIGTGGGIGAFAIWDRKGSYGTASADLGTDPRESSRQATEAALAAAGRPGEIPDLVWLTAAPGCEERVLEGIRSVVGPEALIVGGSAADNDVTGGWKKFGPSDTHDHGVVVSVLFPSASVTSSYQSGYAPTNDKGIATRVIGRRLVEIDGRRASEVYHDWTQRSVPVAGSQPGMILAEATFWPLGRVTREIAGVPFYILAHPAVSHPDGSLDLFADLSEGDTLWQLRGSEDSLISRAGRVAQQVREDAGGQVSGALVIYCGGCMLAIKDRLGEVQTGISDALGDVPWLGVFTFGEQGVPAGWLASHGNLMISCTAFGGDA